jgi:hypothetical protein
MNALRQSVPIIRRAGSTDNPLQQLTVAGAEAGRLLGADRPSEQRLVFNDGRRRLSRRPWTLRLRPAAETLTRRSRRAVADLEPRQPRLAQQRQPIKRKIGMRVLERLGYFRFERAPAHPQAGWRPKEVEDTGARRAIGSAVRVHDERAFIAAFVARVANEGHPALPLPARLRALARFRRFLRAPCRRSLRGACCLCRLGDLRRLR